MTYQPQSCYRGERGHTKVCHRCKVEQVLARFGRNRQGRDKRAAVCLACVAKRKPAPDLQPRLVPKTIEGLR